MEKLEIYVFYLHEYFRGKNFHVSKLFQDFYAFVCKKEADNDGLVLSYNSKKSTNKLQSVELTCICKR
jgi:hypothetical protein